MAKKRNNFWLGIIIGGIFGVLFAPRKGEETRDNLSKELNELLKKLERLSEVSSEKISEVKEEADPYIDSFKKGLEGEKEISEE